MSIVDKEYLKKVLDAVEFPFGCTHTEEDRARLIIALLVQQNMLMTRMFDMLRIAVGLTEDSPQSSGDLDNPTGEKDAEQAQDAMSKAVVCGRCGKGVVPDSMGYCPACRNDLRTQIQMESINRKG